MAALPDFSNLPEEEYTIDPSHLSISYEAPSSSCLGAPYAHEWNVQNATYTPIQTSNPIEFEMLGYQLRPAKDRVPIKILVCCTAYNEEEAAFERTLAGIQQNVRNWTATEGQEAWRQIYVLIISDGRRKANHDALTLLETEYSLYDEDILITYGDGSGGQVFMHLFEHTTQKLYDENHNTYFPPVQLCHALKEFNAGKLNSHLWFFNAFANHLCPKYCFLLDIGTAPRERAMFKLYAEMEREKNIAGCCGEITIHRPRLLNLVVAAQFFEYKVSHILDKSLESIYGYTSVLPGAFSAYRYSALREENGQGPLVEYFRSITASVEDLGPFKGNMYLAEDRVLCYELIARCNSRWKLRYVKNAVAETDVPQTISSLIKQRRRWLNGSLFAILYAMLNIERLWTRSQHSLVRKFLYTSQFCYYLLQTVSSFFLMGNLFIFFSLVLSTALDVDDPLQNAIRLSLLFFYSFILLLNLILALGNDPESAAPLYEMMMVLQAILALSLLVFIVLYLPSASFSVIIAAVFSFLFYFLAGALHGEAWALLLSALQYFMMVPTMVNMVMVFAFCNTHDLSWGTKGLTAEAAEEELNGHQSTCSPSSSATLLPQEIVRLAKLREEEEERRQKEDRFMQSISETFQSFRTYLLFAYLSLNGTLVVTVNSAVYDNQELREHYLRFIFGLVCFFNGARFLGSLFYVFNRRLSLFAYKRKVKREKRRAMQRERKARKAEQHRRKRELVAATTTAPLAPLMSHSR